MKRLKSVLILLFVSLAGFVTMASNAIVGMWQWSNSPFEYPVYIEFKEDGNMDMHKMKPDGLDIDNFKWSLEGTIIYYTRPDADEKRVYPLQIIKNDGTTMILHDSESDMWLEKIK